jgi:hypothetical protein
VTFGSDIGRAGKTEQMLSLANLKWALAEDRVLQD